jgi:hypothetical protein
VLVGRSRPPHRTSPWGNGCLGGHCSGVGGLCRRLLLCALVLGVHEDLNRAPTGYPCPHPGWRAGGRHVDSRSPVRARVQGRYGKKLRSPAGIPARPRPFRPRVVRIRFLGLTSQRAHGVAQGVDFLTRWTGADRGADGAVGRRPGSFLRPRGGRQPVVGRPWGVRASRGAAEARAPLGG